MSIDFAEIESSKWFGALAACPQDSLFHGEGDVFIHTKMVAAEAEKLDSSDFMKACAIFHDCAKPLCSKVEDGRISSRGHSLRGAIMARGILYKMGVPFALRERICNMVRFHQTPFWTVDREDYLKVLGEISQVLSCRELANLAEADMRGRICADQDKILFSIDCFRELCEENNCLDKEFSFPSDHSRFSFFRNPGRDINYLAHDDTRCEVTLMSGLPGAGKDTWVAQNAATNLMVSLDLIRECLGVAPTDNQGAVIQAAKEQAREFLRAEKSFVWNATNITKKLRQEVIGLCANYNAKIKIVYVEVPYEKLLLQNKKRKRNVPEDAIIRMLDKLEVPDKTEAHSIEYIVGE